MKSSSSNLKQPIVFLFVFFFIEYVLSDRNNCLVWTFIIVVKSKETVDLIDTIKGTFNLLFSSCFSRHREHISWEKKCNRVLEF